MTLLFSVRLDTGLDGLREYCSKWGLMVNAVKTKVIVQKKQTVGEKINDKWYFGYRILKVVTKFKYLGCSISLSGLFKNCMLELTNVANRGLFALHKIIRLF